MTDAQVNKIVNAIGVLGASLSLGILAIVVSIISHH